MAEITQMNSMIEIRKAQSEDLGEILKIYSYARQFMKRTGNPNQWRDSSPEEHLLVNDIAKGNLYLCLKDREIVGSFAFIIGEDHTYNYIENGRWHSDQPYGTIHRLASNGKARGIGKACFDYCKSRMDYLRVDTHHDNKVMQRVIRANGFEQCGIIYIDDGTLRIAYDYLKTKKES